MKSETLPTTTLLRDLSCMSWALPQLLCKGKPYDKFLNYIINKNWLNSENQDAHIPAVKDLIKETGLTYEKIKKYLKDIFEDIKYSDDFYLNYSEVEYCFTIKVYDKYISFSTKSLPVIPRIGEQVEIPYFLAFLGTQFFHVSLINHEFQNGKQIVNIRLKHGEYNLYWHLRLDEALEKMEIGILDKFDKSDYQLKVELGVIPKWARH